MQKQELINRVIEKHKDYITSQTLATSLKLMDALPEIESKLIDIDDDLKTLIKVSKL